MKAQVRLAVGCAGSNLGNRLAAVLAPDNRGAPKEVRLSMESIGTEVVFEIEGDSAPTVLSTTQAILRDVTLFEQVWLLSAP